MNLGGVVHLNRMGICLVSVALFILALYLISNSNSTNESLVSANKINIQALLVAAIKASRNGGVEVLRVKDNLVIGSKGKTKEGVNDSVTTADYKSHCAMVATMKHYFPTVKIVSEEAKTACEKDQEVDYSETIIPELVGFNKDIVANEEDITVWIDPLDATKEYTEKLYKYVTTMVCVAIAGIPVIGVIHKPFSPQLAEQTSWAWVKIKKSTDLDIAMGPEDGKLHFIVSMSHAGEVKKSITEKFSDAEIISAAGAGYKVLEVVHGTADAYVHKTAIKKWDICAGNAILNAVGGKLTTLNNDIIEYSDDKHVVNDKGILATMHNHDKYVGIL